MDKFTEFLKKHVKVTLVVVALGMAGTIAYTAQGCEFDVAPIAEAP